MAPGASQELPRRVPGSWLRRAEPGQPARWKGGGTVWVLRRPAAGRLQPPCFALEFAAGRKTLSC